MSREAIATAAAHCFGDRHGPERRLEGAALVNRHTFESDVMRRADEHGDVDIAAAEQIVGVGGNRPRIHQAGVRRDDRERRSRRRLAGGREIAIDLAREHVEDLPDTTIRRPPRDEQ